MIVKCLKNLMLIENILGIYRNYSSQKKIKKHFIIFQIILQTTFHTIGLIIIEQYLLLAEGDHDQIKLIRGYLTVIIYINSLAFVVTGTCYSSAFKSYYQSMSRVSDWFQDDNKLHNSIKKKCWFGIILILIWIVNLVYRSTEIAKLFPKMKWYILFPISVSQIILRMTVVFQIFMFYMVVMIVVNLFKCLISLISVVQERVGSCDISSGEQCDITREQIQEWVELYRDLANCCEKVTLCFGSPFYFSVILSILHNVSLTYSAFYFSYMNNGDTSAATKMIHIVFLHVTTFMLPVVAGQLTRNQGIKIHRVLARFYNTVVIIDSKEAEAKSIKDFIRLIKKNPVEIKLSSKIPTGMYMLPVILMLSVNYLIVLLQFNHII